MFTNDLVFGFLAFAVATVINRLLAERALKRLTADEKARLVDSFSGNRVFSVIAMLIVVVIFFVVSKARPEITSTLVWGLLVLLVVMSVGNGAFSYLKLKKLGTPDYYLSTFLIRCVVYYAGLGILIYTLVTRYLPR